MALSASEKAKLIVVVLFTDVVRTGAEQPGLSPELGIWPSPFLYTFHDLGEKAVGV